jgi:hypothetical protein
LWCWRRMEKISWTDHVRYEEVLLRVKEQRNILHEISKRKANWIGHILRRNCLLWQVIEGKIKGGIEVTGIRGRRRRKLLDDIKKRTEYSHLKEEALDRTMWRAGFVRDFGHVVRQTAKLMNEELPEELGDFVSTGHLQCLMQIPGSQFSLQISVCVCVCVCVCVYVCVCVCVRVASALKYHMKVWSFYGYKKWSCDVRCLRGTVDLCAWVPRISIRASLLRTANTQSPAQRCTYHRFLLSTTPINTTADMFFYPFFQPNPFFCDRRVKNHLMSTAIARN